MVILLNLLTLSLSPTLCSYIIISNKMLIAYKFWKWQFLLILYGKR